MIQAAAQAESCLPLDDVLLQKVLEIGGPRVRSVASMLSAEWQSISENERSWHEEYRRRWWHVTEGSDERAWRKRYVDRIKVEQKLAKLLSGVCEWPEDVFNKSGKSTTALKVAAIDLEQVATQSKEDVREILASMGALVGDARCTKQFEKLGNRMRHPPSLSSRRDFVAGASPRSAALLSRHSLAAVYAGTALAAASAVWPVWSSGDTRLEAGMLAVGNGLRVFFDSRGVELELHRLADAARTRSEGDVLRGVEVVLFHDEGFSGNMEDYYDSENSMLDAVLERRKGIPVSLACVFVAVAERAGLPHGKLRPVNAPGHFLLEYCGENSFFIDVFPPPEAQTPVRRLCSAEVLSFLSRHNNFYSIAPMVFKSQLPSDVWHRVLRNLLHVFEAASDHQSLFLALSLKLQLEELDGECRSLSETLLLLRRTRILFALRANDTLLLPATVCADLARVDSAVSRGLDVDPGMLQMCASLKQIIKDQYSRIANVRPRPITIVDEEVEDDDDKTIDACAIPPSSSSQARTL